MAGTWNTIIVLLLQVVISHGSFGRYLKREERGSPSKLRFTSGSSGFYNASIKESSIRSIRCDMKMGIYIYDSRRQIVFQVDDRARFTVHSHKLEDFVFLRIVPNMALSSDAKAVYTINIAALDNRTKEEVDRTKVYLHVLDVNEFKPRFLNKSIEISVKENLPVGKSFLQVEAYDADSGSNGILYYYIPSSEVLSVEEFSLHPHTGALSLVKPLDFNSRKTYDFRIVAKDKCPNEKARTQSEPLSVRVNVLDVPNFPKVGRRRGKRQDVLYPRKDKKLKFSKPVYSVSVPEMSPPFTPLVRVQLTESSFNYGMQTVNFGFYQGNEQGRFELNSKTGQIYTVQELDYETTKTYNLTVIAYHRSLVKGRTSVIIRVLDINDHSPTFPKLQDEVDVFEETSVGTIVYRAKATDKDTGINKQMAYSIGNINATYFDIDQLTGSVRVAKRLDRDGEKSVSSVIFLMIKASDFGIPVKREGRMILKIHVQPINDNPPVLQYTKCRINVAKNARLGSSVLRVKAIDLDRTSDQTFFSISGNILSIGHVSGHVTLKSIPENIVESSLVIRAADEKSFAKNLNLTFIVIPADNSNRINFTCVDNPEFIHVKDVLSKQERHEKSLTTEKFSQITLPQSRPHKPIILEKPDTVITLREDLAVGSFVTRVVAVDKELKCYGLVLYSIVSGNNNVDSNFAVDMLNGSVYLTGKIDREKKPSYSLKVRAWDTDSPPHYTDVDVQVEIVDINDNGPVFKQDKYEVTVSENTQPGTPILQVRAKDPDSGANGIVTYSLVNNPGELFTLNRHNGLLTLEKMLDYEKSQDYVLLVQAEDSSSQNQQISQASVFVTVKDINDTPPSCLPKAQTFELTRDFPAGAVLGKIIAFDPDTSEGGEFRFSFGSGKAQRLFSLDAKYGILRTNVNTVSQLIKDLAYNLTVIVSDMGAPTLSTLCSIVVNLKPSLSSERPKFLRQNDENLVIADITNPEKIVSIVASLEGSGEMEYTLVDGTGIEDFTIDSKSGIISKSDVRSKSSAEEKEITASHYWLTVNAHLKKHPEVYSNIAVLLREIKVKDEAPFFDPTAYRVSIKENLPSRTEIVQLSVINPNSRPSSSKIVMKIVDGNDLGHFEVSEEGLIRTTQSLDREQVDIYKLNVSVSSPILPKEVTYASVLVTVEDMNDHDPEVDPMNLLFETMHILEQDAILEGNGTFIMQAYAIDKDIGKNAELVFQLSHEEGKIDIDPSTGVLSTKAQLKVGEFFIIFVKICDKGGRCFKQDLGKELMVVSKPRHQLRMLKFKQSLFTFHVTETTQRISVPVVITDLASLLSSGIKPGELLFFSIELGNEDNKFLVTKMNFKENLCQISELDYETKKEHTLVIKVTNGQTSDTTTVKIVLTDINDNAPKTSQSCYQTEVEENIDSGKVIAHIEALDPDVISKGKLAYKIIGIYPAAAGNHSFRVDPDGRIRTLRRFNREKQGRYILTMNAEDHSVLAKDILRTTFCVIVNIKDANDHKPRFTRPLYVTRVSSPLPAGTPLLRLLAVDHDVGTNALLKFTISGGNDMGRFKIDSASGIISSGQSFFSKKKTSFMLDVEVFDSGTERVFNDKSRVKITVYPAKPDPGFPRETYNMVIPENQAAKPVLDVSIPSIQSYYEIVPRNQSSMHNCADGFEIDFLAGIIFAKVAFDFEKFEKCTFSVHAWDGTGFSNYTNVIVNIKDENDNAPKFLNASYVGSIDEGSGRGSEVLAMEKGQQQPLQVMANDEDSGENARIIYSIIEASAKRNFEIDANTGKLITRQVLDREKKSRYQFHVVARDNGSPRLFAFAKVIVNVNDINDKMPEFTQQIYRVQLYTPISNETEVATVHATDGDSNVFGSVHYTLLNHNELFSVSPVSGTLWTRNANLITSSVYSLKVSASDKIFTSTCQVVVNLSPVKIEKFRFREPIFHASVTENDNKGKLIFILHAVGYEIGERITYSIANPMDAFTIDSNTGAIYSKDGSSFDRESRSHYLLVVQGKTTRDPSHVAQGIVNVTVEDTNDNIPKFFKPYYQSVHIDTPIDSIVLQVKAEDADEGSNADIRYEITGGALGYFKIDKVTGVIRTAEDFVKGKTSSRFILEITAKDMGSPSHQTKTRVDVPIVNEDMPVFDQNYHFSIAEDATYSTIVGKIGAKGSQGRQVYYTITSGDYYDQFSLDFNTGELSTLDTLDRSLQAIYNFTVQAADSSSGSWSTTGCTVTVTDVNNHRPMFATYLYTADVVENAPIGTLVATVQASDKDEGSNSKISYSFDLSDEEEVPFTIDGNRGSVKVFGALDYESQKSFLLRIRAVDHGRPPLASTTFLKINILNVNDNQPLFQAEQYDFFVGAFVSSGQFIGKVSCFDKDQVANSDIRYEIPDSTLASVDPVNGVMTLIRKPKRGSSALFQIRCTDGKFTTSARVILRPEEVNEYRPLFPSKKLEISVQEDTSPSFLTVVSATDQDHGSFGKLTYSIDSNGLREKFEINPSTGDVFAKFSLDREAEKNGSVVLPIRAVDPGGRFDTCKLFVHIFDANDNDPMFEFQSYETTVGTETRFGSSIMEVKASDKDSGKNGDITYIAMGLQAGAPVTVNKKTGIVKLVGIGEGTAYQFVVKALDNGYPVRESSAAVRVNVAKQHHTVLAFAQPSYTSKIAESELPGYRVADVKVRHAKGSINYELVAGNLPCSNPTGVFNIDPESGSIRLIGRLDYEVIPRYSLMVKASHSENGVNPAFVIVHVIISNVNDNAPIFDSKTYNLTIPEDTPASSMLVQVMAFDADDPDGDELRYTIERSPATAHDLAIFSLNHATGELTTTGKLNAETKSSYEFVIRVYDDRRPDSKRFHDTTVIRITVLDTNDSPPVFLPGRRTFRVREDHVVGEKIASVLAQDADKDPLIKYYFLKGNDLGTFTIDETSGEIQLVAPLDREITSEYALTVVAYDGVFVAKINVDIIVTDINDNSPVCKRAFYEIAVSEAVQGSPVVAHVNAFDADSDDEVSYSLQGDGANKFLVNERTGELMPLPGIDREKVSNYAVRVLVTDKAGHSCYSDVYIEIIDENDNRPVFQQTNYVVPVRENATVSSMITRVQATDYDKGSNRRITYRLLDTDTFSIQPRTGMIILNRPLSKQHKDAHSLTVEAYDDASTALSSSVSVNVVILGVAERPPEFTKQLFVFSVPENLAVNSIVGVVEIVKKAAVSQGSIEYELLTGNLSTFSVDKRTGSILLRKQLDHEKMKSMSLSVRAMYSRLKSLSSVVPVTIHIQDINDNPPVFGESLYSASVDENVRAGSSVLQVFATDMDEGINGRVAYRLVKSRKHVPFKVDKQTGIVSVAGSKPIDREEEDRYIFQIRAFDAGTPSLFSDATINITIADLNDNPPEVDKPNSTVIVQNPNEGDVLFSWISKDRDFYKNGPPFTYTIIKGDKSKFNIVDETDVKGSLLVSSNELTEGSSFDLVIRVTDNGSPPQSSLCYLTVFVVKPSFAQPVIAEPTMFFLAVKKPTDLVTVGRIRVMDRDKVGLHQFKISDGNDDGTFSIETLSGLVKGRPKQGLYTLTVEVSDGKYSSSAVVTVIVNAITDEVYKNSIVMTALDISADDFVHGKMKALANHMRRITSAKIENIVIWAVQTKDTKRKARDVDARADTEVAFAVRRTDERGFVEPAALQSSLKSSKEELERKIGLSVLITVTDPCAAAPCPIDKKCAIVVKPVSGQDQSSSNGLNTIFTRDYACLCLDGSKGPDCAGITACSSNPCRENEKCTPIGSNFECEKDINGGAVQLDGKDYVSYVLKESFDSVFRSLQVQFRTEATDGYLFYAKGHDYCILEIYQGKVRFKFDFGTGQGIVKIDDIQVNDGRWHKVEVIRDANRATLSLDEGKFKSEGRAKGENVKINLDSDTVYFGAGVIAKGTVENGFRGCLRHAKLNGQLLPWNGNNSLISSGRSFGVKRSCKDSEACKTTKCPLFSDCINTLSSYRCQCMPGHTGTFCKATVTCADNPCRNGGTCTYFKANGIIEYRCTCRPPYTGAQCQTNGGLCASHPCKNGGKCENINNDANYQCKCPARYHGPNCELDSDPCASSPCFHGAKCVRAQYGFKCLCPAGTKGRRCGYGHYCEHHRCGASGKCTETLDGPVCRCDEGYKGTYCQFDINECLAKQSKCLQHSTCVNTIGSYFCNCTHSNNCNLPEVGKVKNSSFDFMQLVYYVTPAVLVIFIIIVVLCYKRRKSQQHNGYPDAMVPDIKYPHVDCIALGSLPPQVPHFTEGPPDYYTDGSADFATTALYDPSQDAFSPQSTVSGDSCLKQPPSSIELSRKLPLHSFQPTSTHSSPKGSGNGLDAKGSASDVSDVGDHLHGPYHWDYSEVPEDVVNRPKPNRTGSKEGSRMGLSYNYGYEETPKLNDKLPEKPTERRDSAIANPEDSVNPNVPKRPLNFRLSWQSLAKTEMESPKAIREKKRVENEAVKPERSPSIQRAAASRGSENSLLESYHCINTQLSMKDFNNRYSLTLEDDSSLYLQDYLGGEYPAPPSETCPSDIESCTRPSMSVAFSDIDDAPYARQRRMLPSEISCLDDNLTETSYNSDDDYENDDYNEKDPLDPNETRKLEREIKILFKDIKNKTEAAD